LEALPVEVGTPLGVPENDEQQRRDLAHRIEEVAHERL
jgi:hypothetical protein